MASAMNTFENEEDGQGIVMAGNAEDKHFEFKVQDETEFPCVIPASCNWYCSTIISCLNGYCAVGGKNALFMFNLQIHPPICEWDMCASPAVSIKVTAVALITVEGNLGSALPDYVAVGLEDGLTRIIATKSKTIFKEHRKHMFRISAMSWAPITPKLVLTGDNKGNLSIWDYEGNSIQIWNPIPIQIICLQMSPVKSFLFVVGYQNGNIIVGDCNKLEVLLTLKSHLDEVSSLSWCPVSSDGKFCFVSGSKDRTIRLWEVTSERSTAVFSVPKRSYGKKKEPMRANFFLAVLWLNEMQIISGLQNGDLLCWDTNGKTTVIGAAHDRIIFALCNDILTNQFVSVSMDRQFIVWNGNQLSLAFKIPTFGGFLYSLSTSINNPYSVAIGVGDNVIGVLSTSDSNIGYDCSKLWEGIKSKVTVVSVHPTYDDIIGYGTDDGHVGCYSLNAHKSDISVTYHKKVVYSLTWAPHYTCEDFSADNLKINCLYTVGGEGAVLMHKMGAFNKDASNIGDLIKKHNDIKSVPSRSDLAWRADYTYFALGNGDGSIDLYITNTLKLICTVNFHKKVVNCMSWHHNYSYNEEGTCYSGWLASGSNEDVVCVTDLSCVISNTNNEPELLRPYRQLHGHTSRITRVVWNPHKNGILASSSFDGTVQIWDVEGNAPLANFHGHIGRVYSVLWSYLDGDIVYSGGEDFTLRRWKISQQCSILPPTAKRSKYKKKKKENKENIVTQTTDMIEETITIHSNSIQPEINGEHDSKGKMEDFAAHQSIPKHSVTISPEIAVNVVPRREHKGDGSKKKKIKSLLKKTSLADGKKKEVMQEDCVSLAKYLKAEKDDDATCKVNSGVDPTSEENINLAFFTTRHDAHALLAAECRAHEENGSYDQLLQLEVWRNNIGGLLDKAVEHSFLNDTLVALAPLGGYDMWKASLLAYAEQLEKKKNFHLSAVYYLAMGDVYKAINVLKDNGYFKEALVMAKIQLGSDDPVIKELYLVRGKKLADECNYEQAAECFLAADYVEDAITTLAKRGDAASLFTSLKVADIYQMEKQSSNLLHKTAFMLHREQKWSLLHELLPRYSKIEITHFQAVVGEFLVEYMFETELVQSIPVAVQNHMKYRFFTNQAQMYPSYINEKDASSSTPSFLMKLLYVLERFCNFTKETCCNFDHINFQQLQCARSPSTSHLSITEVWDQITNLILHGIIYLIKGDCVSCFKKWLIAFDIFESSGCQSSTVVLFDTLFPKHYMSFNEIIQIFYIVDHNSVDLHSNVRQSFSNFMAFKCSGIMYFMWYRIGSRSLMEGKKLTETIELNRNKHIEVSSEQSACSLVQSINESSYEFYCIEKDFYSCISWLASVLLSDLHISCDALQSELKCVEEQLLELDIKKRLNDHILSRKQIGSQCQVDICKPAKIEDGDDILKDVGQPCENVISVVTKVERSGDSDVCSHFGKPGVAENLESEMLSGHLTIKKLDLLGNINSFPSDIKEYAFPRTTESFSILMLLCLTNGTSDERVNILRDDIVTWGRDHGIYPRNKGYIEELMKMLK